MKDEQRNDLLLRAQQLSSKWGTRLDEFKLPCPLCRGNLHFHGVGQDILYEFAEGEIGAVTPLQILPITFLCDHCGYTAEFDADLFNPAHLARMQGATEETLETLRADDFRVIVPMTGQPREETLLDIASALCGERDGEVIVMNVNQSNEPEPALAEKLRRYHPPAGTPAPVHLRHRNSTDVGSMILEVARQERCNLLVMGWRGWTHSDRAVVGTVIDPVLSETLADVLLVTDHGLPNQVERILLLTAGGPNARVAAPLAVDLAKAFHAQLHVLSVVPPNRSHPKNIGESYIQHTLQLVGFQDLKHIEREVIVSARPLETIIEQAQRHDVVMLGAAPRNWRGKISSDSFVARITRNVGMPCLIVHGRQTPLQSMMSRLFG